VVATAVVATAVVATAVEVVVEGDVDGAVKVEAVKVEAVKVEAVEVDGTGAATGASSPQATPSRPRVTASAVRRSRGVMTAVSSCAFTVVLPLCHDPATVPDSSRSRRSRSSRRIPSSR